MWHIYFEWRAKCNEKWNIGRRKRKVSISFVCGTFISIVGGYFLPRFIFRLKFKQGNWKHFLNGRTGRVIIIRCNVYFWNSWQTYIKYQRCKVAYLSFIKIFIRNCTFSRESLIVILVHEKKQKLGVEKC